MISTASKPGLRTDDISGKLVNSSGSYAFKHKFQMARGLIIHSNTQTDVTGGCKLFANLSSIDLGYHKRGEAVLSL